jgi:hypothetical protein
MANHGYIQIGISNCSGVVTHVCNGYMVSFTSEDKKSYVVSGLDKILIGSSAAGIPVPADGTSSAAYPVNGTVGKTYNSSIVGVPACTLHKILPPGIIIDGDI